MPIEELLYMCFTLGTSAIIEGALECSVDSSGATSTIYIQPTFDPSLNITSYTITGASVECEPCTLSIQCRCVVREERTNVTITAFSGETLVEPSANLTVATGEVCMNKG